MGFISIALLIIGLRAFFIKQKHITLIAIVVLSSSYFRLVDQIFLIGPISLQHSDLALILIFLLLPFRSKKNEKQFKSLKTALLIFFIFLGISIFYDAVIRDTTLIQIFRTTRKTGYLLFLFLIISFELSDYKKLLKFLVYITIIHSIMYISQYIFGYSFGEKTEYLKEFGDARYTNLPTYILPVLVICLYTIKKREISLPLIILFIITIILGQSRGAIISVISVFLVYLFLQQKIKLHTFILIPIVFFISYNIIISYYPIVEERFIQLYQELNLVGDMDYSQLNDFFHEGSFIFRFGLAYERYMYVIHDPIYMFLGVGYIPDIDIIEPIFTLGTRSPMMPTGFEQYNTADSFLPNIITRYGILGSILFISFLIKLFSFSYKNRSLLSGKILFTYLCSILFISFSSQSFYNGQYFIFTFIMIGFVCLGKREIIKYKLFNNI